MIPFRRIGAPVVVTVAFGNLSPLETSTTWSEAAPSSSIERLPPRRVMVSAWVVFGKNGRSAFRIWPSLS